ncbi:MAG: pantoate--beta-alanine ligase [Acidaminococcaceae bacterium]|nr:pantoate--beta-alanine ligase [Acidaminococcaceae bacterium]
MKLIHSVDELRREVSAAKADGLTIGLVPTMGALHEGHGSLIKQAHAENDLVIVSVFVNPTQFAPGEDLEAYPRTLRKDCALGEKLGADIIFAPSAEEMYPSKENTWVEVTGQVTEVLCGRSRPVHFRGVTTVVAKLFNLTAPDRAYFGQKDAQQVEVIRRMIKDLFFNINLRVMPIVRESDGLAKSSRNTYLSVEERQAAPVLRKSLLLAADMYAQGERNKQKLIAAVTQEIESEPLSEIDYVEVYALPELREAGTELQRKNLLAVAVRFGTTRLIDNIVLEENKDAL